MDRKAVHECSALAVKGTVTGGHFRAVENTSSHTFFRNKTSASARFENPQVVIWWLETHRPLFRSDQATCKRAAIMRRKIEVTELILRDAHQSLPAIRKALEARVPACEDIDKAGCAEANVRAGQMIEKGDLLLVREAMKMVTELTMPIGGKVKEVKVNLSDSVKSGQGVLLWE